MKEFNETMIKNYREFNNGGMFEIEGYTVKFNNASKELKTDYPHAEDLRVWWFGIEEETTEKVSIADIDGLKFEVVDTFPKDYIVWDINTTSEYLPLCEVRKDKSVNVDTLKCIKLESAEDVQCVLNAVKCFKVLKRRTLEALKKYYEEYHGYYLSMSTVRKVGRVEDALEAFKKVGIE